MNPNVDPLHAGIAGVELEPDQFELGHGVVLTKTFAHFMAPFLMAFAPAPSGGPHPTPWSAVSDGISINIHVELFIPSSFTRPNFYDRLNTVWWITALIRLRSAAGAHTPIIADRSLAEIPKNWKDAVILPVEVLPRRLFGKPSTRRLSLEDLLWLKETWLQGGHLMNRSETLNDVFQALDSAGSLPTRAVALLAVWGALERLFSPSKQELSFRVSANIAAYLEPPGQSRLDLHRRLIKLYDARSKVAHGRRLKSADAWLDTYALANRIVVKILSSGQVPSKEMLEAQLFAPSI
jgi:hypothetical protein